MNPRTKALKGYMRRDPVSHRTYDRDTAVKRFDKTGGFAYKDTGLGHKLGFEWARKNKVDPHDEETKYSKNSPSFDEGVHMYKAGKIHALRKKMR